MDGEAWWATVHGVAKSQARLSDFTHSVRPKPATKNYNNHLNYVILITYKHHRFSPTLRLALAQGWDVLDHCLSQDMKS